MNKIALLAVVATIAISSAASPASATSFLKKLGDSAQKIRYDAGLGGNGTNTNPSPSTDSSSAAPASNSGQYASAAVPDKKTEKVISILMDTYGVPRDAIHFTSPPEFGGYGAPARVHVHIDGKDFSYCKVDLPTTTSFGWHAKPDCN